MGNTAIFLLLYGIETRVDPTMTRNLLQTEEINHGITSIILRDNERNANICTQYDVYDEDHKTRKERAVVRLILGEWSKVGHYLRYCNEIRQAAVRVENHRKECRQLAILIWRESVNWGWTDLREKLEENFVMFLI